MSVCSKCIDVGDPGALVWSNEGGVREGKRHNSHSGICSSHFHSVTMVSGFLYLVSIL